MRRLILAAVAAATFGGVALTGGATPVDARDGARPTMHRVAPAESYVQYRAYGPRRSYGGGYYGGRYHRRDSDNAVAAGVAGLAAGALIGGAIASQQAQAAAPTYVVPDQSGVAYCAQRFRSYDPASGTYLGNDGLRHSCP